MTGPNSINFSPDTHNLGVPDTTKTQKRGRDYKQGSRSDVLRPATTRPRRLTHFFRLSLHLRHICLSINVARAQIVRQSLSSECVPVGFRRPRRPVTGNRQSTSRPSGVVPLVHDLDTDDYQLPEAVLTPPPPLTTAMPPLLPAKRPRHRAAESPPCQEAQSTVNPTPPPVLPAPQPSAVTFLRVCVLFIIAGVTPRRP